MMMILPKMINLYKGKENIKIFVKFDVPNDDRTNWLRRFGCDGSEKFEGVSGLRN